MNPASILVVDDEPQIRRVLRSTLAFRGYEFVEAGSGEEALELASKVKPGPKWSYSDVPPWRQACGARWPGRELGT